MRRVLGKVDRSLPSRIRGTDDCDLAVAVGSRFGRGRAVMNAGADQPFDAGGVQSAVLHTGSNDCGVCPEDGAVG